MLNVYLYKMKKEDVDDVYSLEELVHPGHHWSKNSFYNELGNNLAVYYVIKTEENKLIGYIGVWQILEEAHICTLSVHPDYRKLQLGQILLIQAISDCYEKMIKYITLEVRESNYPAISLYEKFLFEAIGMRKNYYQDNNENAIIMFTQNIWYDTFKNNFVSIKDGINKVTVNYVK